MSQTEKEALLPALFLVSLLNLTLDNKSYRATYSIYFPKQ